MNSPLFIPPWQGGFRALPATHPQGYAPTALWFCTSVLTGQTSAVNGSLAQVLHHYPQQFSLALFSAPSAQAGGRP